MELQIEARILVEAMASMMSHAFAANPDSIEYDPEELLTRFRDGATEDHPTQMPRGEARGVPPEHGVT